MANPFYNAPKGNMGAPDFIKFMQAMKGKDPNQIINNMTIKRKNKHPARMLSAKVLDCEAIGASIRHNRAFEAPVAQISAPHGISTR